MQDSLEVILKKGYDLVPIYEKKELNYFFAAIALQTFRSNSFNTIYRIKDFKISYDDLMFKLNEFSDYIQRSDEVIWNSSQTIDGIRVNYDYTEQLERVSVSSETENQISEGENYILDYIEKTKYTTDHEWYDWQLIKLYNEYGSCPKVAEKTGIKEITVYKDVQRIKEKLKSEYDKIVNR
jgi:hypothetical protein